MAVSEATHGQLEALLRREEGVQLQHADALHGRILDGLNQPGEISLILGPRAFEYDDPGGLLEAIELLADMLRAPALDRAELSKLRDRQIDLISAAKDNNLPGLLPVYGAAWLFADHPYGTAIDGDETSLANISHRDLTGFYQDFVGADRLVISVVGDIDAVAVINALTEAFADWRRAAQPFLGYSAIASVRRPCCSVRRGPELRRPVQAAIGPDWQARARDQSPAVGLYSGILYSRHRPTAFRLQTPVAGD